MKNKLIMGYIFCERKFGRDEKLFLRQAKKKNIKLIMFNISKKINERKLERRAKKCRIIFNNSAEDFASEIVKTFEELGVKVVDSSKTCYYSEDKWMFFMECKKNNIPSPKTILLSENLTIAKEELDEFNHWPVILKRIYGTQGEFVDRAKNIEEAERIIQKFWKKGSQKVPIIAQEFIKSPCYRVTVIGNEIVQTALKVNKRWKATGVYAKKIKKFRVSKKLRKLVNKIIKTVKIKICGIDFLKKNGKWIVLEVNSTPAFDFFEEERESLISQILDFLKKEAK